MPTIAAVGSPPPASDVEARGGGAGSVRSRGLLGSCASGAAAGAAGVSAAVEATHIFNSRLYSRPWLRSHTHLLFPSSKTLPGAQAAVVPSTRRRRAAQEADAALLAECPAVVVCTARIGGGGQWCLGVRLAAVGSGVSDERARSSAQKAARRLPPAPHMLLSAPAPGARELVRGLVRPWNQSQGRYRRRSGECRGLGAGGWGMCALSEIASSCALQCPPI